MTKARDYHPCNYWQLTNSDQDELAPLVTTPTRTTLKALNFDQSRPYSIYDNVGATTAENDLPILTISASGGQNDSVSSYNMKMEVKSQFSSVLNCF